MGAWGDGFFDNDAAADWSADLDDQGDALAFVIRTLDEVASAQDDLYLDAFSGHEVIAAAAWLAAGLDGTPVEPSSYAPDSKPPADGPEVRAAVGRAVAALSRVLGPDSEWRELWDGADDGDAVRAVTDLRDFLATLG